MKLKSNRIGEVEIDENQIVDFPEGIPGFENEKEFTIFPLDTEGPFYYMHSTRNPDLCLVLAVPFPFFPDYEIELPPEELENLEAEEGAGALAVFTVLTIPEDFKMTTANLLAPVVVNTVKRKGVQFVPAKSRYSTRHPIFANRRVVQASAGQGL
ncbi:MAG: flagellar assembly protein FliW [Syntrophomonadaceae bacterium]|nr:flagellar assembly protein FliW [Syntrophomonadaceae bacterium]